LTFDQLTDLARNIRGGANNEFEHFWSYDSKNKKLDRPRPENSCRDLLLAKLQGLLRSYNQYTRAPESGGYGVYLVLWFGGLGMKPPPQGAKPRNAQEVAERLIGLLEPEERHRIFVCVIDCALPQQSKPLKSK
jgi:hypothetical protein